MRSISIKQIESLNPSVKPKEAEKPTQDDVLVEAIKKFPAQLSEAIKQIPAPVIAPAPKGSWVIDVKRDKDGKMSQMVANFHQTKTN